jgi:hypothetical protein
MRIPRRSAALLFAGAAASVLAITPQAQATVLPPISFVNADSGLCLQPDPANFWADGDPIVQMRCNGTTTQGWNPMQNGSIFQYENIATGKCLNARGLATDGTPVQQWTCNAISNEKWTVVGAAPGEGDLIRSAVSGTSSHCMDVVDESFAIGAAIELHRCDRTRMQGWFRVP